MMIATNQENVNKNNNKKYQCPSHIVSKRAYNLREYNYCSLTRFMTAPTPKDLSMRIAVLRRCMVMRELDGFTLSGCLLAQQQCCQSSSNIKPATRLQITRLVG